MTVSSVHDFRRCLCEALIRPLPCGQVCPGHLMFRDPSCVASNGSPSLSEKAWEGQVGTFWHKVYSTGGLFKGKVPTEVSVWSLEEFPQRPWVVGLIEWGSQDSPSA